MELARDVSLPATVGPYEIVGRLAAGGMAELLVGRRLGPSGFTRMVALKRILPHLASDEDFRNMFLDEARLAAMIQHPNVVRVEDLGQDGNSYYMAMELLQGDTVASLQRSLDSPLDPEMATFVVAECAAGLHAAHLLADSEGRSLEVVHRDVTPHNVFVTLDGHVKLIDFGVARAAQRITTTQSGVIKGKFAYMSPEQLRDQNVDHRSDQFSLGVVLFELLTRRRLFARSSQGATVHAVVSEDVPPPSTLQPTLSPQLDAICRRALARRPEDRFSSCAELRDALVAQLAESTGEGRVRERLAALMVRSFPEARSRTGALASVASAGTGASSVPSSESTGPSVHRRPTSRRPLGIGVALLLLLASAAIGVGMALRSPDPTPVAASPAVAPVFLELSSEPSGASVQLGGVEVAVTPARLERPPSAEPVEVRLTLANHEPWSRELSLDVSQRVHATLAATAPAVEREVAEAPAMETPLPEPTAEERRPAPATAPMRTERPTTRRARRRPPPQEPEIPLWD